MRNLNFPVNLVFKISTFANDFYATDANGITIGYIRQKMFKLKESVEIFSDESRSQKLYQINADKWLDFNTAYAIKKQDGQELGKVCRKGWASLWKANYEIVGNDGQMKYRIQEKNPWAKVMDSLLGEIPLLGMLTGYLFNPAYSVKDLNEKELYQLKKQPSFFGRKFDITETEALDVDDELIVLSLMMMVLLERRRG
ncbi:MAG: hypothetical protein MRY83_06005 [Flavobacteriales bacterium]|nr:hypothetical protein [Flavobacteriales bacterium]